jgi:hypothetical protein
MTVAALPSKIDFLENGVTTAFAVPFRFLAGTIAATRVLADGTVVALASGVDFSTSGGETDAGGTLTLTGASVSGATLRLRRVTPRAQGATYNDNDRFPAESHEQALDRAMLVDQEQDDKIADTAQRALLVPDGETAPALPPLAGRGDMFLRFSPDGRALLLSTGTADQAQAFSREFAVTAGAQAAFDMPFPLLLPPVVHRNGVKLPRGSYSFDGQTVTLASAATSGDVVEISIADPLPQGFYDVVGAFSLRDLSPGNAPVPIGTYFGTGGNSLSFETLISSPDDGADSDNQRAAVLIVTETADDGNSEEQTLCLLTTISTGYNTLWAQSTAYSAGQNVKVNTNVYRCITPGVSAASGSGPSGKGASIVDGSCVWRWINDAAIDAKVGIYNEVVLTPGAGQSWAQANNLEIEPGVLAPFIVNTELDLTNNCGTDSEFGGLNKYCLYLVCQGANTSTAFLEFATHAAQSVPAAKWGLHFAPGDKLAENAVIGIDASAPVGIGFGTEAGGVADPTFTDAAIKDESNSPTALRAVGTYSETAIAIGGDGPAGLGIGGVYSLAEVRLGSAAPTGILIEGSYDDWQIFGAGFSVDNVGGGTFSGLTLDPLPLNYADDAAAAAGGVPLLGVYRTGSILKVRAT